MYHTQILMWGPFFAIQFRFGGQKIYFFVGNKENLVFTLDIIDFSRSFTFFTQTHFIKFIGFSIQNDDHNIFAYLAQLDCSYRILCR